MCQRMFVRHNLIFLVDMWQHMFCRPIFIDLRKPRKFELDSALVFRLGIWQRIFFRQYLVLLAGMRERIFFRQDLVLL